MHVIAGNTPVKCGVPLRARASCRGGPVSVTRTRGIQGAPERLRPCARARLVTARAAEAKVRI